MENGRVVSSIFLGSLLLGGLSYGQDVPPPPPLVGQPAPAQPTAAVVADLSVPAPRPAAPIAQPPAPARLFPGAKVLIEDASEFGMALTAAFLEKKVPLTVVTDPQKADFILRSASQDRKASSAERVTRLLVIGWGSGDRYHATVSIVNRDGDVVFAHNIKKGNFQDAANSTANEIKNKGISKS